MAGIVTPTPAPTISQALAAIPYLEVVPVTEADAEVQIRNRHLRTALVLPPDTEPRLRAELRQRLSRSDQRDAFDPRPRADVVCERSRLLFGDLGLQICREPDGAGEVPGGAAHVAQHHLQRERRCQRQRHDHDREQRREAVTSEMARRGEQRLPVAQCPAREARGEARHAG